MTRAKDAWAAGWACRGHLVVYIRIHHLLSDVAIFPPSKQPYVSEEQSYIGALSLCNLLRYFHYRGELPAGVSSTFRVSARPVELRNTSTIPDSQYSFSLCRRIASLDKIKLDKGFFLNGYFASAVVRRPFSFDTVFRGKTMYLCDENS
jgi:hypothetical protein